MQYIFPFILLLFSCGTERPKESIRIETQDKEILQEAKTKQTHYENKLADYIPDNYFVLDSAMSQFNNETIVAYVIAPEEEKKDPNDESHDRMLLVLRKIGNTYEKMASNAKVVLCKSCGGVFGDPFVGIGLKNNVLNISHYGGSAWRWGNSQTFRYQNKQWELIGASYYNYWVNASCSEDVGIENGARHEEDINFSTKKMHIIHTKDDACEPYEDYWEKFEQKKAITLSDFPGQASQWPNGKLEDGDGK